MSDDLLADVLFEWNRGPYRLSTEDSLVVMARLLTLEAEVAKAGSRRLVAAIHSRLAAHGVHA